MLFRSNFWTLKLNATQQESINSGLSAGVTDWINDRLAVWTKIVDPRSKQLWYTTDYGGGSAQAALVLTDALEQATPGQTIALLRLADGADHVTLVDLLSLPHARRLQRHVDAVRAAAVLAGPSCDSADVLYEKNAYELPLALEEGDMLDILSAGAYTTTYSSVGFNGFAPLAEYTVSMRDSLVAELADELAADLAGDLADQH
mgnify:CR=1 FL=1